MLAAIVVEPSLVATVMFRALPETLQVREVAKLVTPVQVGELIVTVLGAVTLMISLA